MEHKVKSNVMLELANEVLEENQEQFKALLDSDYTIAYLISDKAKKQGSKVILGTCRKCIDCRAW